MADASIPVDLFNPGQVFACLGFLEAADVLLGDAEGGFDWSDEGDVRFRLRANGDDPFGAVLDGVVDAGVNWLSPSGDVQERDGGTTVIARGISASKTPAPADLPGRFVMGSDRRTISFGYWADGSGRFSTTFKKSTNGASSHVRLNNGLSALREIVRSRRDDAVSRPFDISARSESLFRIDPRGSADPLTAGFSADKLRKGKVDMRIGAYPACEILAVLGLEHARPARETSQCFRYHVWGVRSGNPDRALLPPILARSALGEPVSFLQSRRFAVEHQEVKRGGDRKIVLVIEETNHDR